MKLFVLGALSLAAASSHAVLINFDNLTSGTTLSSQYTGVTFAAGTGGLTVPNPVSTTQGFATNTDLTVVTLSSANSSNAGAPLAGNVLRSLPAWTNTENGDAVFTITFAQPISAFSLDFGAVATYASSAIYAYTATGTTAVASSSAVAANGLNQTVSLSGLTGVTKIAVTAGDYFDYVAVDNINYTPVAAVPEPATMAALGLGAAALLRRRRKA